MKKHFYSTNGVGRAKYVVNFWDGEKRHTDGSRFYDVRIFKNKPNLAKFEAELAESGYNKGNY
jgi:hypothetical protein